MKSLNRVSIIILTLACITMLFTACSKTEHANQKPNIIYILADDLGYGDISAFNPEGKIATPNIDQLAKEGMKFTDAHSPSSVCTPTRYALMTGRYPWRSRLPKGVLRGYSMGLLEKERLTIASLLKKEGYKTGMIGKWHLGVDWVLKPEYAHVAQEDSLFGINNEVNPEYIDFTKAPTFGPKSLGFDYTYFLPASLDMPPYCYLENDVLTELPTDSTEGSSLDSGYTGPFWRPGKKAPSFDFFGVLPTFTNKAKAFLNKQNKDKPFFLYLALAAPHTPWMPTDDYKSKSAVGEYGDFVQMVDAEIGKIMHTLDSLGMSENTIVFFASDNGPFWRPDFVNRFHHKAAGNLRGMKGDIYEGGHRIPFIARWPGKIKPNMTSTATTTLTNLLATVADILNIPFPENKVEDSYSILPILTGESDAITNQPAVVHSASNGFYSIRKGQWKLIEGLGSGGFTEPKMITPKPGQPTGQLYNLEKDLLEENDIYSTNPDKVKELGDLLNMIRNSDQRLKNPQ